MKKFGIKIVVALGLIGSLQAEAYMAPSSLNCAVAEDYVATHNCSYQGFYQDSMGGHYTYQCGDWTLMFPNGGNRECYATYTAQ